MCNWCGKPMSATNCPLPRSSGASSSRSTDRPMTRCGLFIVAPPCLSSSCRLTRPAESRPEDELRAASTCPTIERRKGGPGLRRDDEREGWRSVKFQNLNTGLIRHVYIRQQCRGVGRGGGAGGLDGAVDQ